MPAADERCQSCENVWLEKASARSLGRWGSASTGLVKAAKWSSLAGGLGLTMGILLSLFPAPAAGYLLLWWVPVALLLLGFPVAIAAVCALPFVRAAERGVDLAIGDEREKFLQESEDAHAAKLLSAGDSET